MWLTSHQERLMLKYYMWAVGEKALSYVPYSRPIYNGLGYLTTRTSKRRLVGCGTSYHLIRKARELTPAGGTILDFGTAWHHHDAFLLYLTGDYKIYLFDIQDRAWLSYIRTYLQYLIENLDSVAAELSIDPEGARRSWTICCASRRVTTFIKPAISTRSSRT
jgi:hypothetical protein